ncbi:hypothetical protein POM88_023432 [Heracleum sosnowskyi]|uniref:Disease resistance R13L4/SHOC-2-like LRR domain-containing protein n=1 Tax=Heracleum sosnowskyi TaxID=360622 RepID=A0AAD8MUX5_9APIA|nr:hypothetical protein POM88_023432 [Heracleum sosnowskyi]
MGSLHVLDLMGTSIECLPDSLIDSKKLAVLYLNECTNLLNLPSIIGKLELLEVLDISGSGVKKVPTEIQSLKHLKRFLVSSGAFSGTDNILDVISGLTELQELLIDTESEKGTFNWKIVEAVMESVKSLTHMTSLQFRFLDNEVVDVLKVVDGVTRIFAHGEDSLQYFIEDFDSRNVQIFFGCPISPNVKIHRLFQRYVKYCNGKDPSPTVLKLLSKSDAVEIAKLDNLEYLPDFDFAKLSAILVENCNKIKYIFGPCVILSRLEELYLYDMQELESVSCSFFSLDNLQN